MLLLALAGAGRAEPVRPPAWVAAVLARLPFPPDVVPDRGAPATRAEAARTLAIWVEWGLPAPLDPGPALLATELAPELAALDPAPPGLPERLAALAGDRTATNGTSLRGTASLGRVAQTLRRLGELEARRRALTEGVAGERVRVEDGPP